MFLLFSNLDNSSLQPPQAGQIPSASVSLYNFQHELGQNLNVIIIHNPPNAIPEGAEITGKLEYFNF